MFIFCGYTWDFLRPHVGVIFWRCEGTTLWLWLTNKSLTFSEICSFSFLVKIKLILHEKWEKWVWIQDYFVFLQTECGVCSWSSIFWTYEAFTVNDCKTEVKQSSVKQNKDKIKKWEWICHCAIFSQKNEAKWAEWV